MDDFLIVDVSATLAASKRASYRESVCAMYQALVFFLESKKLTTHTLLGENEQIPDDLIIRRSDLSDIGFEVIRRKLDCWLDQVSSATISSEDTSILEAELQVVISSQASHG